MESILKEILHGLLVDCLLTPGEREKKRLMQLSAAGSPSGIDRVVVYGYGLSYIGLMLGSIWSHPLSSHSLPALNPSQHQGLFK